MAPLRTPTPKSPCRTPLISMVNSTPLFKVLWSGTISLNLEVLSLNTHGKHSCLNVKSSSRRRWKSSNLRTNKNILESAKLVTSSFKRSKRSSQNLLASTLNFLRRTLCSLKKSILQRTNRRCNKLMTLNQKFVTKLKPVKLLNPKKNSLRSGSSRCKRSLICKERWANFKVLLILKTCKTLATSR